MIPARILAQLGALYLAESEALAEPYKWPPKRLTEEQRAEVDRLRVLAARCFYRARVEGHEDFSSDGIFGEGSP